MVLNLQVDIGRYQQRAYVHSRDENLSNGRRLCCGEECCAMEGQLDGQREDASGGGRPTKKVLFDTGSQRSTVHTREEKTVQPTRTLL